MDDIDIEYLKKIFLENSCKRFSNIIPSLDTNVYGYNWKETRELLESQKYNNFLNKYTKENKNLFGKIDFMNNNFLHGSGPGRRISLFDFDFLYHENNKSKDNDLARKMFYDHTSEYKKFIKLWNNDTSNKKMRLLKTYEIDYHNFEKIPSIEFLRVIPKIVKDDDIFNYSECMLENFIKITKYKDMFESSNIENILHENEIKKNKATYDIYNIFDKSFNISYELKQKGYIKEDNKSSYDEFFMSRVQSKCDILKDYITIVNSNKNNKDLNNVSFRYKEIKKVNNLLSNDYKKFCTVEIEEND